MQGFFKFKEAYILSVLIFKNHVLYIITVMRTWHTGVGGERLSGVSPVIMGGGVQDCSEVIMLGSRCLCSLNYLGNSQRGGF